MPPIENEEQLMAALKAELGYCPCADDDALIILRDILLLARDRSNATDDAAAFSQSSRAIERRLELTSAAGLASWFVFALEQRDLIWHGFRMTDIWITAKGAWLLDGLARFADRASDEDASGGGPA